MLYEQNGDRMPQYQKRKIHPHSEEELVRLSEGLKIVIWDKTEYTTIVLKSGDAAILPQNRWHSPLSNSHNLDSVTSSSPPAD